MTNIDTNEKRFGLNSFTLRMIAYIALLWGVAQEFLPESTVDWSTYTLWFSYAIFAFLLVEGVTKTSSKRLYLRRLILFTVLTEVPFDLLYSGKYWNTERQSVMVTLLACYIIIMVAEYVRENLDNMIATFAAVVSLAFLIGRLVVFLKSDLGIYGILLVCFFYITHNVTYSRTMQFICSIIFIMNVSADNYLNIMIDNRYISIPDKGFMVLGIMLTWLYNGKRGPNHIVLKVLFYVIPPLSLLAAYLLKIYNVI